MFFRSHRGRRDPHFLPIRDYEDPIRLDEARLDAWAMALGQPRRPGYRRRSHRGMLPDVDFSRTVPAERGSGPIALLFQRLTGKAAEPGLGDATPGDTAGPGVALGETGRKPYVWLVGDEQDASDEVAPDAKHDDSRAA